jgi:acyl-CoA reductase-like NAD-dependent aldehyde dehydrogenase
MNIIDNDLLSIQEARILIENAAEARTVLASFPQSRLDGIVEGILVAFEKHAEEFAEFSCNETDYGNPADKLVKNRFVCHYLREALRRKNYVGIIGRDDAAKTMDVGVPLGVVAALCSPTSPVSTTVYNVVIALKSGNVIVFAPHPRSKNCVSKLLDLVIETAAQNGCPDGAISYLHYLSPKGSVEMMSHAATSIIINNGVAELREAARASGKPVISGGVGGGPAFIERTADIERAVKDIVISKTFDNGIAEAAEQSVVVDSVIEREVRQEFVRRGAYFMSSAETEALGRLLFTQDGRANSEITGLCAEKIAKKAFFCVPPGTKLLLAEQKYASPDNPYSKEKLCPVLAYYVENDWLDACEKCIELLLGEKKGHTLVIHSSDEEVIRQFALKKPVGRMLVNTPAAFGGMGGTTNLFPAMTLGGASAGQGVTSDNVSPLNLIYIRKVAYAARSPEAFICEIMKRQNSAASAHEAREMPRALEESDGADAVELFKKLLAALSG